MKLKEVSEIIVDSEHKTPPTQDTGYPYVRTPNIGKGRLLFKNMKKVGSEIYKEWTKRAVPQKNDLILAREAPVGNVAIIKNGVKPVLGQRTVLIRPNTKKVLPNYLLYLLLGKECQQKIQGAASGATVSHLNMSDIRSLELPELPNLTDQQKIASTLSAFDDLIENNNRRIAILEEMARLIYREWFVHLRYPGHENDTFVDSELGRIPKRWNVGKLKTFFKITYGDELPISKVLNTGDYPVYGGGVILGYYNKNNVSSKVTLITCRGSGSGKVWRTQGKGFVTNNSLIIYPKYDELSHFFNVNLFENMNLRSVVTGSAQPQITIKNLENLKCLIPKKEVLQRFNYHLTPLYNLIDSLDKKNIFLKDIRDLLLQRLIAPELKDKNYGKIQG